VIDLVMAARAVAFTDAVAWLKACGVAPALSANSLTHAQAGPPRLRRETPADSEVFEALLAMCPLGPSGASYLALRGITRATSDHFRIGQIRDAQVAARQLVQMFGYERVAASAILSRGSTPSQAILTFRSGQLLVPFFEKGRCVYYQTRAASDSEQHRWLNLRRRHRLYNLDVLGRTETASVAICEGVTDCLSAFEMGLSPLGLVGASASIPIDHLGLLQGKTVAIFTDRDERGNDLARRVQSQLLHAGIEASRYLLPDGLKDLNDLLRAGGRVALTRDGRV
jgi:DNA primase